MRPLTLKPSLSSGQFAEGPCKHALPISFRPDWQCTCVAESCGGSVWRYACERRRNGKFQLSLGGMIAESA